MMQAWVCTGAPSQEVAHQHHAVAPALVAEQLASTMGAAAGPTYNAAAGAGEASPPSAVVARPDTEARGEDSAADAHISAAPPKEAAEEGRCNEAAVEVSGAKAKAFASAKVGAARPRVDVDEDVEIVEPSSSVAAPSQEVVGGQAEEALGERLIHLVYF